MSMVDVSAPLSNPFLLDTFSVLRRKQKTNSFGEAVKSYETVACVAGVVYPEGLNDLTRRPEAQTNAKSIVVITRYALRGESYAADDGASYQPDIVVWNGNKFVVVRVEDYSNFAAGFVKATAESIDIQDFPPTPTPNRGVGPSVNSNG